MRELQVHTAEEGMKLLSFLEKRLAAGQTAANAPIPRSMLHRWIRSGQVRINGKRAKAFDRLDQGDLVRVPPFAPLGAEKADASRPAPPFAGEKLSPLLRILAVENDILVLEKDAGLASQPGTGHTESVAEILKKRFRGAPYIPAPAHRLDRQASGILLAGRSFAAQRMLSEAFADGDTTGTIHKEYLAWVHGVWPDDTETTLRDILVKSASPTDGFEKVSALPPGHEHAHGKEAQCIVCPLRVLHSGQGAPATLMRILLETGRTHQIRVQFASRGHPLIGDVKYGGAPWPRLLLHAARLTLVDASGDNGNAKQHVFSSVPPWPAPFACDPLTMDTPF